MAEEPRSMRDRMLAGEHYLADDPELVDNHHRAMALLEAFNATTAADLERRRALLSELFGAFGEGSQIRPTTSGSPAVSSSAPEVSIGRNTVVGAGSVVTKDLPPDVLAVGNPARVLRPLDG